MEVTEGSGDEGGVLEGPSADGDEAGEGEGDERAGGVD